MTRQDTVIKIAKITKIIGEWKFRYDLDGEVEMETLSPELLDIATWIRDIQQYIESDSSPVLVRLIMNIGFTDMLDDYIHEHKIHYRSRQGVQMGDCHNCHCRQGQYDNQLQSFVYHTKQLVCPAI